MSTKKKACFFDHTTKKQLQQQQQDARDIKILQELGFSVTVATNFKEIPWGCDLYFAWWASGSILPLIKAKLFRKPIVVIAGGQEAMLNRDSVTNKPFGYLAAPWYKKLATRICLRYSTRVLVVSRYMIKDVKKLGATNPLVVHNCIDTKIFNLSNFPRTFITTIFNSEKYAFRIKREEIFIRSIPLVLQKFPEQKIVVIGKKGNMYPYLQKLASSLKIEKNIEFIDSVDNTQIPEFFQQSKVYVQISDTETFGVSIAEAMSCGTPVVVSKRGAIPEVVGNCGIYVDHNNPKSVAAGITSLLKKSEKDRHEIGLRARARIIENFSYERRKKSIQQIIESI